MSTGPEARRDEGDSRRGQEASLRDRAHLSQQRRLKQATQFLHKDSADLLPLDSLKRLGTSKDLVSPLAFSILHILSGAWGGDIQGSISAFRVLSPVQMRERWFQQLAAPNPPQLLLWKCFLAWWH